ncbi:terminase [Xenorhabdus hominickii]|uniref:Replicative DNA helicase n=1 Tax=Xenorhabdus hominickii TaxID=351679 RepID=A0A1V0M3Y9_XENHO|nr:replicative DNA helicase [Xenorhabdus hominickii]PHM52410.1 terminase [Xenorhabdus hominickii]
MLANNSGLKLVQLHEGQMKVFKSPHRFKVVCAGRRWGKSRLSISKLLRAAIKAPKQRVWYIAPTYQMARQILWDDLQELIPRKWVRKKNDTTMNIILKNGSEVALKGADKPDCFDDETDILTVDGWCKIKDLPESLAVMTLNTENNKAEWQVPTRYIHKYYEGMMYRVESNKLDAFVTPNHRFLVESRKGKRKFRTLDEMAFNDKIPASTGWVGEDDPELTHDMLAFIGFYIAEGCARKDPGTKCSYEITFAQTKGKKGGDKGDVRSEFLAVLDRMGIKYNEKETVIKINNKQLWESVVGLGVAHEKRVPNHILNLPPEKLETLLHWMILGDGTIRRGNQKVYYTTSKGLAGDVQEICLKIAKSARISIKRQKSSYIENRLVQPKHVLYAVSIFGNKFNYLRDTKESYIKEVNNFKGMVHCVEVPNSTVYVRRNGKAMWSGNSLRGVALHFVVLDEFQDMKPDTWYKVIRPTLSSTKGEALIIGTPKGYSAFHKLWSIGQSKAMRKKGHWKSWQFVTADSPFVPEEEVEAAREDMDPKSFAQEYLASFENMSGRVYYPFERKTHVRECAFNPKLPIWIGQDFNIDPMSSVVLQPQPNGEVWAVDEIVLFSSNTAEVCDELERRFWRWKNQVVIFPDPAGSYRQHARGESDIDIFKEKGFTRIDFPKKHPPIADRVNSTNRMLMSAAGTVRLYIDPKCKYLIESFEKVIYKPGSRDVDKAAGVEHSADAIGYPIHRRFPVKERIILGGSR